MGTSRRVADGYVVDPSDVERFRREGHVSLRGVLGPQEVAEMGALIDRFLRREIPVPGRDFCDMSGSYDRPPEEFAILNVMLPRVYHPALQGSAFERRAAAIAAQLVGEGLGIDYDQILAKRPRREDAVFPWHQDLAYWPVTPDMRTATFWLALDPATPENGCMRFVSGSNREPRLRVHRPLAGDREQAHTLVAEVDESERFDYAPLAPGDVSVHDERVLHGSGGNRTDGWRRAYVLAFRARETIATERALGFTHSHNDATHVLDAVGRELP